MKILLVILFIIFLSGCITTIETDIKNHKWPMKNIYYYFDDEDVSKDKIKFVLDDISEHINLEFIETDFDFPSALFFSSGDKNEATLGFQLDNQIQLATDDISIIYYCVFRSLGMISDYQRQDRDDYVITDDIEKLSTEWFLYDPYTFAFSYRSIMHHFDENNTVEHIYGGFTGDLDRPTKTDWLKLQAIYGGEIDIIRIK